MKTAKDLQASFGRRKPNPQEVALLHKLRHQDIEHILQNDVITINGILGLDWGGRFAIANRHFDKCNDDAKHALLHDQHHAVRAAASLFKPPVKLARVGAVALAIMDGKPNIGTLNGVKSLEGIEEMIISTHPFAVLEAAEKFISGFEDDNTQFGVGELLAQLRACINPIR